MADSILTIGDIRQAIYHSDKWSIVTNTFISDVWDFLEERFKGKMEHCPGVLTFSENGKIERKSIGRGLIPGRHRSLFLEERLELARIGARHYWTAFQH